MPKLNIDLSQVKEFTLLPAGKYPAVVDEVELKESGAGKQYLNWKFDYTQDDFDGQVQYMMTSLSPKALFRLKPVFKALGVAGDQVEIEADDDTGIMISPSVIGTPCILDIGIEVYEGQKRNYIKTVLPMFDENGQARIADQGTPGRNIQ